MASLLREFVAGVPPEKLRQRAESILREIDHRAPRQPGDDDEKSRWVESLRRRHPDNVAAVALAAKHARIIWALLARGQDYRPPA